jgi:hypothetical protein
LRSDVRKEELDSIIEGKSMPSREEMILKIKG